MRYRKTDSGWNQNGSAGTVPLTLSFWVVLFKGMPMLCNWADVCYTNGYENILRIDSNEL